MRSAPSIDRCVALVVDISRLESAILSRHFDNIYWPLNLLKKNAMSINTIPKIFTAGFRLDGNTTGLVFRVIIVELVRLDIIIITTVKIFTFPFRI